MAEASGKCPKYVLFQKTGYINSLCNNVGTNTNNSLGQLLNCSLVIFLFFISNVKNEAAKQVCFDASKMIFLFLFFFFLPSSLAVVRPGMLLINNKVHGTHHDVAAIACQNAYNLGNPNSWAQCCQI